MFEKNLSIALLLDFYGELLSDRKRQVLDDYYNNDLSLSEIADAIGISRQGVRELIKSAEEKLMFYENRLRLAKRFREAGEHAAALRRLSEHTALPEEFLVELTALEDCIG